MICFDIVFAYCVDCCDLLFCVAWLICAELWCFGFICLFVWIAWVRVSSFECCCALLIVVLSLLVCTCCYGLHYNLECWCLWELLLLPFCGCGFGVCPALYGAFAFCCLLIDGVCRFCCCVFVRVYGISIGA